MKSSKNEKSVASNNNANTPKNKNTEKEKESITNEKKFINTLKKFAGVTEDKSKMSTGDMAALRRALGTKLGDNKNAMFSFYKILRDSGINFYKISRDEGIFYLVATLYANYQGEKMQGNFGETVREIKMKLDSESIDQKFAALLESYFDYISDETGYKPSGGTLGHRLGQLVKLAKSKGVGINWERLLKDLRRWQYDDQRVQREWARQYYYTPESRE
ncbi:MAG: type I-E CRISPR-associated protein Cse2/CasB [Promethearchaeota archaeon]